MLTIFFSNYSDNVGPTVIGKYQPHKCNGMWDSSWKSEAHKSAAKLFLWVFFKAFFYPPNFFLHILDQDKQNNIVEMLTIFFYWWYGCTLHFVTPEKKMAGTKKTSTKKQTFFLQVLFLSETCAKNVEQKHL